MKRNLAVLTVLAVFFLAGCASYKGAWKDATKINTIEAYQAFLDKYRGERGAAVAPYINRAEKRIKRIQRENGMKAEWQNVKANNKLEGYQSFVRVHRRGPHIDDARKEIGNFYRLNDEELAKLIKLISEDPAEAKKPENIDKLIYAGADCLDVNGNLIDQAKGRRIADTFRKYDSEQLGKSFERVILADLDRRKVFFLGTKLDRIGVAPYLNTMLLDWGNVALAEVFLNSGSAKLKEGGEIWARSKNDLYVVPDKSGRYAILYGVRVHGMILYTKPDIPLWDPEFLELLD